MDSIKTKELDKAMVSKCQHATIEMRRDVISMTYNAGDMGAHIGGGLSMIEIMSTLFIGIMKYDIHNTEWEFRDRFILSKGHGAIALYAAMKQIGLISQEELLTFKKNQTNLYAHPSMNMKIGIEFSSGSLGQGLSLGVGTALALKRKKNFDSKVFVLLGDGECNEGSIWEAVSSASHYQLDNLIAIIDKNGMQYDGYTDDILSMDNLGDKWCCFGWEVISIDGHSTEELLTAFSMKHVKPLAIIANTVKGKGVSFMENNALWHNNRMTIQQYQKAMDEQVDE